MASLALLPQLPVAAVQSVVVSWNPSSATGVAGYKIYSGGASGVYTNVIDAGNATNVTLSGLVEGSTNYFSATTYDASTNESSYSTEVTFIAPAVVSPTPTNSTVTIPAVLNTVTNLVVAADPTNANGAVLSWTASTDSGVAGYKIYYGTTNLVYTDFVDAGLATNVSVSGLASGTTYYFSATEYDAATNESDFSSQVSYDVPAPAPTNSIPTNSTPPPPPVTNNPLVLNPVANLAVTANPSLANSVILSWTATTDVNAVGYQVFSGTGSGNYSKAQNVGLVNSLVISGLTGGATNFFTLREYDAHWNVSPLDPEVTWVSPNTPPTLNALGNLNLNINTAVNLALSGITSGSPTEKQTLKITATSSNPGLIPTPKITYTSPKTTGTLSFKPANNQTGTATITVTVNDGGSGNNTITRTFTVNVINQALLAALPKFSKQLTGGVVLPGKAVTLGVTVTGKAPFKYQWKLNGINLPGATAATYAIKSTKAANTGAYSVQVSNSAGMTNSITAQLFVVTNTAPTISAPLAQTGNGQFSFQVTGVPGYKYVIDATTDLHNWTAVATNLAPFIYTETNTAGYSQRFYRSYYQP